MKIKPRPFCGGEAKKIAGQDGYITVMCVTCGATGPLFRTRKPRLRDEENPAIEAWNRRTEGKDDL